MKILEKGGNYLKTEILKRNLITENEIKNIEHNILNSKYESDSYMDADDSQNW